MEAVKRIEIITNSLELQQVLNILSKAGISGYSIIKDITGSGDRGRVIDDLESAALTNVYVLSVCNQEKEQSCCWSNYPYFEEIWRYLYSY